MKLRIARVGTVRANVKQEPTVAPVVAGSNTVPSPDLNSMIESVSKPLDRRDIVRQEQALADKGHVPSRGPANPAAPPPPDLGEYIRKQRS